MNHEQDQGKDALPLPTPEYDAPPPHPFAEAAEAEPFFAFEAEAPADEATAARPLNITSGGSHQDEPTLPPPPASKEATPAWKPKQRANAAPALMHQDARRSAPNPADKASDPTLTAGNGSAARAAGTTKKKLIGFLHASAALGAALLMRGAIGDAGHGAQTIGVGVTLGGSFLFLYALMQFVAGKDVTYPKADVILRGGSFAVIAVAAVVTLNRWTTPAAAPESAAAAALGTADLAAKASEAAAKAAQLAARAETERQIAKLRDDLKTSVGGVDEVEAIRRELNAYIAANNQRLHSLEAGRAQPARQTAETPRPEATQGLQALKAAQALRERAKSETPERALSALTEARLRLKKAESALKAAGLPGKLAEARLTLAETLDELAGGSEFAASPRCPAGASAEIWRTREAAEAYALASTPEARKAAPAVAAAALNGKGKTLFLTRAYTEAADAFYESAALFRENGMMAEAGVAERNRGESLNALSYCPSDDAEKTALLKNALQSYESAALYFDAAGDKAAYTSVQAKLGQALKRLGDLSEGPAKQEAYAKAQEALNAQGSSGSALIPQRNKEATQEAAGQAEFLAAKTDPAHEASKTTH